MRSYNLGLRVVPARSPELRARPRRKETAGVSAGDDAWYRPATALHRLPVSDAFLPILAHEMLSPISRAIGWIDVLMATSLGSDQREYAEGVRRGVLTLERLVHNALEMARLERSRPMPANTSTFSAPEVLSEVLENFTAAAADRGLTLDARVDDSVPPAVCGDRGRLTQVLVNLVDNALKFTRRGGAVVSVRGGDEADASCLAAPGKPAPRRGGSGRRAFGRVLVWEVADTGVGIPKEQFARIFEPYAQGSACAGGGLGLGLYLVRLLVEFMGGAVAMRSAVGRGSAVRVILPEKLPPEHN